MPRTLPIRILALAALLALSGVVGGASPPLSHASVLLRVYESTDANGLYGKGDASNPSISYDGHYVAFTSAATNLVPGDTNGMLDVFVKDTVTGAIQLASVGPLGESFGASYGQISQDGNFVVFRSGQYEYSGFANPSVSGPGQIYVRDLANQTTTLASVLPNGSTVDGEAPSISGDGRYVTFLVYNSATDHSDLYIRDVVAGTTKELLVQGVSGSETPFPPLLSANGSYVALVTDRALAPQDTNGFTDVYVISASTGQVTSIPSSQGGVPAGVSATECSWWLSDAFMCSPVAISADGQWVAYQNQGGPSGVGIYLYDTTVGGDATWIGGGEPAAAGDVTMSPDEPFQPSISADGRYVSYEDDGRLYVYDGYMVTTQWVNRNPDIPNKDFPSGSAAISGDGQLISWNTWDPTFTYEAAVLGGTSMAPVVSFTDDGEVGQLSATGDADIPVQLHWHAAGAAFSPCAYTVSRSMNGGTAKMVSQTTLGTTHISDVVKTGTSADRYQVAPATCDTTTASASPQFSVPLREEGASQTSYSRSWTRGRSKGALGGYVKSTKTRGATLKMKFRGRSIAWIAPKGSSEGLAKVFVDGRLVKRVSLWAATHKPRRIVFSDQWPAPGSHTVTIVCVGTAGHPHVPIDAFATIQ